MSDRFLPSLVTFIIYYYTTQYLSVSARLYGVNYSTRNGPDWAPVEERCKSAQQVMTELQQLQRIVTDRVRVYSMTDCDTAAIVLNITQQLGMQVWLGIWADDNQSNFESERSRMLELMNTFDFSTNVIGIHVTSEAIYREEITVDEAISMRNIIKQDIVTKGWTSIPVTIADIIDTNIEFPELITVDETVVTFNQFPFWENTVDISNASSYMRDRVALVEAQAGGRQIIVTETGWADAGSNPDANAANPTSMIQWLQAFICLANERSWLYFWFDAYDSDWRRINENNPSDVEGHFGIFYQNGTFKPHLQDLILTCGGNPIPTAPTSQPANATTTTAPSLLPTSGPVSDLDTSPSKVPVSALNTATPEVTETPTSSPVLEVVGTPTKVSSTIAPIRIPTKDSIETPTSELPTVSPIEIVSDQCVNNEACDLLGLTGACCPTIDNWSLRCCGGPNVPHYQACFNHSKCDALGLEDACCPTVDGKYLDCCGSVPDECLQEGACPLYSAKQYKLDLEAAEKSQSAHASSFMIIAGLVIVGMSFVAL